MTPPTDSTKSLDDQILEALATTPNRLGSWEVTTVVPEYALPAIKELIRSTAQEVALRVIGEDEELLGMKGSPIYWRGYGSNELRAEQRQSLPTVLDEVCK